MNAFPHDPHDSHDRHDPHDSRIPGVGPADIPEPARRVRLGGLADLIAAVPYALTYVPHDAVVVLVLSGNRVRFVACQSLAAVPDRYLAAVLNQALTGVHDTLTSPDHPTQPAPLRSSTVPQALVVGYGTAEIDPILTHLADTLIIPVRDVVRVHEDRWWSLTCTDPCCCPPGARVELSEHARLALLVADGVPAATRADRAQELRPVEEPLLTQVAQALVAWVGEWRPVGAREGFALLAAAKTRFQDDARDRGVRLEPKEEAAASLLALGDPLTFSPSLVQGRRTLLTLTLTGLTSKLSPVLRRYPASPDPVV